VIYFKSLQLYLLCVIIAKFLYQLPLFCATPPFTLYDPEQCSSSDDRHIPLDVLMKREDYMIGLRKYWGSAAYPQDGGIVRGLLPDIVCVAALLVMKRYLVAIGVWDYVRVNRNIY
jgi:piezo-type mechanosensitive ion channel component 1/2